MCDRSNGLIGRRSISLEARAAPLNPAQAAPSSSASLARNTVARSSSNGDNESSGEVGPSGRAAANGPGDVLQSAEDDLDLEDTVRAKTHHEVSINACCLMSFACSRQPKMA